MTGINGGSIALAHGDYAAEITSTGASLRSFTVAGRDLVVPFGVDELRPLYRGAVLAPWPNRIVDGRYSFDGTEQQLPLTEPERGHALHGLVGWSDFRIVAVTPSSVRLATEVVPQAGYPHRLAIEVEYRLDDDGLTTTIATTNTGASVAPYGASVHPYLVAGHGRVDDWTFELAAAQVLEVDGRLAPVGIAKVAGGPFDFATARPIGDLFIDHAFTGLPPGRVRARLTAADRHGVEMEWGSDAPWVQVHTGDRPESHWNRRGLAVEPMTCPPDAFNSGTDLIALAPGDTTTFEVRLRSL